MKDAIVGEWIIKPGRMSKKFVVNARFPWNLSGKQGQFAVEFLVSFSMVGSHSHLINCARSIVKKHLT